MSCFNIECKTLECFYGCRRHNADFMFSLNFKGKKILYDILAFAKESVNSHVTTLGPQNFPANDKEPWLVDFFAPVS